MDISSAKTARNSQARPAVATRGSIHGPKGPQNGQNLLLKTRFWDPSLYSLVNAVRDPTYGRLCSFLPSRPCRPAFFAFLLCLPSSLSKTLQTPQGRPSEAAGGPSVLSVWLSVCLLCLSVCLCLSGLAVWLSGWLSGLCLSVSLSPS